MRWMKLRRSYSNCNLYRQGVMAGSSCIGGEASIMATAAAETIFAFFFALEVAKFDIRKRLGEENCTREKSYVLCDVASC